MNIVMIGDIFGEIGREMIEHYLPLVKQRYDVDLFIANGENVTHGKGLNKRHYEELLFNGISLITMGNHTYAKREIFDYIDEADRLIVPFNRAKALPGTGSRVIECKGKKIRVTNLLGLTFMDGKPQNPFEAVQDVLANDESDIHIIDFHAEATSEKLAFANYVDGKVAAVLGTHTHVATADERLLPKGTAYQSDVGMTGPYNSIIGCETESIVDRFVKGIMTPFKIGEGEGQFNAVLLRISDDNKVAAIERIRIDPDHPLR